jgi:spermidine/putrescine ABC transporter ATP-binding subunit
MESAQAAAAKSEEGRRTLSSITLEGISKAYGDFLAVNSVDLKVAEGEFVSLLGASGSGKTTCLRMVAGFVQPTQGKVYFGDQDVTRTPPHRRNTGMVFQQYALFPHLTVRKNIAYGLKVRRMPSAEIATRTEEALRLVQMSQFGDRYPRQLSGGQKQRVALARAVIVRPQVLLLDEPLAALDLKLREELQIEIKRVQKAVGITTLFVTHDQAEALSLSDRVVVMRDGKVLQVDEPTAIYSRPANRYVASFIGRMNFLDVEIIERHADGNRYKACAVAPGKSVMEVIGGQITGFAERDRCVLAFRPEDAVFDDRHVNRLSVTVDKAVYVGESWTVVCTGQHLDAIMVNVPRGATVPRLGERITLSWRPEDCLLLKPD